MGAYVRAKPAGVLRALGGEDAEASPEVSPKSPEASPEASPETSPEVSPPNANHLSANQSPCVDAVQRNPERVCLV